MAGPEPDILQGRQAQIMKKVSGFTSNAMRYALSLPTGQVQWQGGAMRFSP